MTFTYPLPSDTRDKFRTNKFRCSNLSLLLDRYLGYPQQWKLEETERNNLESVKNPTNKQKDFLTVFGTQEHTGEIILFDAVPTKVPTLEPDIMNNHYLKYYGENQPPTPYQSPVPVYFLTLGRNSEFAFAVAARKQTPEIEKLVYLAAKWLQQGISTLGVGAKTAAGYGYLTIQK